MPLGIRHRGALSPIGDTGFGGSYFARLRSIRSAFGAYAFGHTAPWRPIAYRRYGLWLRYFARMRSIRSAFGAYASGHTAPWRP